MKKLFFSAVAMAALVFVACDNDEDPTISLNAGNLKGIPAAGKSETVTINSPVAWSVEIPEADKEWLSVDHESGEIGETEVTFTIGENKGEERSSDVTISGTGVKTKTVTVTQDAFVAPEEGTVDAPEEANILFLTISFEPFVYEPSRADETPEYSHILMQIIDGDDIVVSEGNATDNTFDFEVTAWGEHTFKYIAWIDLNGDGQRSEDEIVEGDEFKIKFEAPTEKATLAEAGEDNQSPDEGSVRLEISDMQTGVLYYQVYGNDVIVSEEWAVISVDKSYFDVTDGAIYTVKAVLSSLGAEDIVYGPASNEVHVSFETVD